MRAVDQEPPPPEPPDLDDGPSGFSTTNEGTKARSNGHRPLPEAPHAEAALLGTCLVLPDATQAAIAAGITRQALRVPTHRHIWDALVAIIDQGGDPDAATVHHHLTHTGHPPPPGLITDLTTKATWAANIGPLAHEILDAHHRRRTILALDAAVEAAYQGDHLDLDQLLETTRPPTRTISWDDGEDVAAILTGDYEPLVPDFLERTDGQALIYPGLLHWLFSIPGIGKTMVALHAAHEAMASGIRVMYLDWENSRRIIGKRLQAMGATPAQLEALLFYQRPPPIDAAVGHAYGQLAHDTGVGLVVIDGFAKALNARGLDEDSASDVLTFLRDAVDPLTAGGDGAAVLVLDHVAKDKESRGLWPRGSGAKQGEVSGAAWSLQVRHAFSKDTAGTLALVQAKDREGEVGTDGSTVALVHVRPDDHGRRLTITLEPPTPTAAYDGPTACMDAILEHLATTPDVEYSGRKLVDALRARGHGFKDRTVTEAAARLHIAGRIRWRQGPRKADLYSHLPVENRPTDTEPEGDESAQEPLL